MQNNHIGYLDMTHVQAYIRKLFADQGVVVLISDVDISITQYGARISVSGSTAKAHTSNLGSLLVYSYSQNTRQSRMVGLKTAGWDFSVTYDMSHGKETRDIFDLLAAEVR